ncbi:MAG: hypothetical protein ACTSPE_09250 [Candidatus Thorarchaeota archaeon]
MSRFLPLPGLPTPNSDESRRRVELIAPLIGFPRPDVFLGAAPSAGICAATADDPTILVKRLRGSLGRRKGVARLAAAFGYALATGATSGRDELVGVVEELARDPDDYVKEGVALAVGILAPAINDPRVIVSVLERLLAAEKWTVRQSAALSLALASVLVDRIDPEEALSILGRLIDSTDEWTQIAPATTIGLLAPRFGDPSRLLPAISALKNSQYVDVKLAARVQLDIARAVAAQAEPWEVNDLGAGIAVLLQRARGNEIFERLLEYLRSGYQGTDSTRLDFALAVASREVDDERASELARLLHSHIEHPDRNLQLTTCWALGILALGRPSVRDLDPTARAQLVRSFMPQCIGSMFERPIAVASALDSVTDLVETPRVEFQSRIGHKVAQLRGAAALELALVGGAMPLLLGMGMAYSIFGRKGHGRARVMGLLIFRWLTALLAEGRDRRG